MWHLRSKKVNLISMTSLDLCRRFWKISKTKPTCLSLRVNPEFQSDFLPLSNIYRISAPIWILQTQQSFPRARLFRVNWRHPTLFFKNFWSFRKFTEQSCKTDLINSSFCFDLRDFKTVSMVRSSLVKFKNLKLG